MHVKLCICLVWDVLWCPIFQVKSPPALLYVFMPVLLLDSSNPTVSTPRRVISGQSGTPDCRAPFLVRLFMFTTSSSNIIHHSHHLHIFSDSDHMYIWDHFLVCLLQRAANLPLHITIALFWGIYCPGLTSSFCLLSAPSAQRLLMGWLCSKSGYVKGSSTR